MGQSWPTEKPMFYITLVSSLVAVIAAATGVWSSYEAHEARIQDERPFIAAEAPKTLQMTENVTTIKNFGKSPALNVHAVCKIVVPWAALIWSDIDDGDALKNTDTPYLLPNGDAQVLCTLPAKIEANAGMMYGVVKYEDKAGRIYQTPFCFRSDGDKGISQCRTVGFDIPLLK